MNLVRADFYRIFRDKTLYVLMAALAAVSLLVGLTYDWLGVESASDMGDIVLKCIGADTLCTVLGLAIALFCGRDFEQNTIRNKICCGERRSSILLSKLLESYVLAALLFVVAAGSGAVAGLIWFEAALPADFWSKVLCQLLIIWAFASMMTAITAAAKNVKTPIIVTIVLFVVLNPLSILLPGMGDAAVIRSVCRGIYMTASNMLLSSAEGVYTAVNTSFENGEMIRATVEYADMYANVIAIAIAYGIVSLAAALLLMRRQEYK